MCLSRPRHSGCVPGILTPATGKWWFIFSLLAVVVVAGARAQESLFAPTRTGLDSGAEGTTYELGTVFRATVSGKVTDLRVYALASETGVHTARLWRNTDNTLIGGPFSWTYGGTTGWITLDIPDVSLAANTDYTVVVSTGAGGKNYPFRAHDLDAAGGNGAHLTYPLGAGVFSTTASARPATVFQNSNYYRDVVFVPDPQEPPTNAPVRINEFLAENKASLADEDGAFSDWIELYNPQGTAVSLAGYQLTDGTAAWTFPATTLGPQSFLVVFASGKDRSTTPLHTNFKLSGAGEYLALRDATGTVLSEFAPAFPAQHTDVSYGRGSAGDTGFFLSPTPGSANGTALAGFVADTVFSVRRGTFTAPVQVALSTATPGAEIRYTLNGTTPLATSALYTAPLTFGTTATLRVRAFKPNYVPTNTDTNTYVFPADLFSQTNASTLAYGWPPGPVNGQVLRYGMNPDTLTLYSPAQQLGALAQIPLLSIVTDQASLTDPATGLYVNASVDGLERAASLELLPQDLSPGFQIDAGLRMRGGQSRGTNFPKHSFNLFFRSEYGSGKLSFPIFGPDGAQKFDTLSLRCEHGYAYADPFAVNYRTEFTAMRDVACRELWAAAGYQSTRSRYYHLLLNGQYWGLYQTQERAQEDFAATYFGGAAEEYDGVAATGLPQLTIEATSGDLTAWTQLWTGTRAVNANPSNANYFALLGRNADGTPNATLPVLLDPHELAAYLLVHYYTGHSDEPLSVSFGFAKPNNFRALRRRGATQPWHFFLHDGESSLRATEWVDNRANAAVAGLGSPNRNLLAYSNPEWMHEDLLANAEYRLVFADEAQRLLLNGGPFTAAKAQPIWDGLAAKIDQAVIGESIRWAQGTAENQANWAAKVNEVRTLFFPSRSATVIAQLRQRNIFPAVDAPTFSQRGGQVTPGFSLTLSAANGGTIYYTTDGSDPRAIGGAAVGTPYAGPLVINAPTVVRARFLSPGGEWSALDQVTFTTFTPAVAGKLIVSKIQYHPPPPSAAETTAGYTEANDFEYLELQNVSADTLDLRGVKVNAGITFDFATSALPTLAPGGRVVLVENTAAFALRYGSGHPVAGAYTGNLSDGGEALRLIDGTGAVITLFTYDDVAPWPLPPDGDGPALVLKAAHLDPTVGTNWRASYSLNGKPGEVDLFTIADWRAQNFTAAALADPDQELTAWGHLANPDGDAYANVLEYALGTSPIDNASIPNLTTALVEVTPGGQRYLQATFRLREGTTGLTLTPQITSDLAAPQTWQALTPISTVSQGDNTALVTVRDPNPFADSTHRFIRLKVTVP